MTISICVFDAYGTLFDVGAAARRVAGEPGREALADHWVGLAELWRQKQLQYSWLRAASGVHTDFWSVTADGLDYALEALGLDDMDGLRARLLQLYWELDAYAEVPAMLEALKSSGRQTAILSNGSPAMLDGAVTSAGIGGVLDAVMSVESVGVFKPDPRTYAMVETRFGCPRREVLFVSSNGWDAAFAAAFGFRTVWANRRGEPVDRLPGRPDRILESLESVPEIAAAY